MMKINNILYEKESKTSDINNDGRKQPDETKLSPKGQKHLNDNCSLMRQSRVYWKEQERYRDTYEENSAKSLLVSMIN